MEPAKVEPSLFLVSQMALQPVGGTAIVVAKSLLVQVLNGSHCEYGGTWYGRLLVAGNIFK